MLLASGGEMFAVSEKGFFHESYFYFSYLSNFLHRSFFTFTQGTFKEVLLLLLE